MKITKMTANILLFTILISSQQLCVMSNDEEIIKAFPTEQDYKQARNFNLKLLQVVKQMELETKVTPQIEVNVKQLLNVKSPFTAEKLNDIAFKKFQNNSYLLCAIYALASSKKYTKKWRTNVGLMFTDIQFSVMLITDCSKFIRREFVKDLLLPEIKETYNHVLIPLLPTNGTSNKNFVKVLDCICNIYKTLKDFESVDNCTRKLLRIKYEKLPELMEDSRFGHKLYDTALTEQSAKRFSSAIKFYAKAIDAYNMATDLTDEEKLHLSENINIRLEQVQKTKQNNDGDLLVIVMLFILICTLFYWSFCLY